jgi:WD repeat-containing protein 68
MDTSRNTHYNNYAYSRPPPQEQLQPPPTKEIYQYDAPWLTYALDWCKTTIEQKSFRLAIGSFIEDSNNKVNNNFFCNLLKKSYSSSLC